MAGAAATMRAACAPAARASGRAARRGAVAEGSSNGSGPSRAVRVQEVGTSRLGGRRRAAAAAALAEGGAAAPAVPVGAVQDSPYGVEVRARPPDKQTRRLCAV